MKLIKTKNKMKYKWNDVLIYRLQQILYYFGIIIPFPFMMFYLMCVDFYYSKPFDPRYTYEIE